MKIVFTKHAKNKFKFLKELGWNLKTPDAINDLKMPDSVQEGYSGTKVASKSINSSHNLRIVYSEKDDIITVVTFYPVRKYRYD